MHGIRTVKVKHKVMENIIYRLKSLTDLRFVPSENLKTSYFFVVKVNRFMTHQFKKLK